MEIEMNKNKKKVELFCPFCKSKNLKPKYISGADYSDIGESFICKDCKYGFGFLLQPKDWD